jgi:hypothetical protein
MNKNNAINWEPEIEIIRFAAADIVTTSGVWDEDELPVIPAN